MSPTIKCYEYPMKLRELKAQRTLTSLQATENETTGFELFVSRIPPDADEDELIPFFEQIGPLHTFRLMLKLDESVNRGHAYITYICEKDAKDAIAHLNGREFRTNVFLSIARSFNNCRIFIGGIPVNKTKDEVWHELQRQGVRNIVDVIMYRSYSNRNMNRGFVFVEFPNHKFAAKMRLKLRGLRLWNYEVVVDWSVPQPLVTDEEMAKVKIIYLNNLNVTESREDLHAIIERYISPTAIEKIYKFKDYAFVHVVSRDLAEQLVELLKEHFKGTFVEVTFAKPRNNFTRPSYRKLQMKKNKPYLPKSYREDSPSRLLDMILGQTPTDLDTTQDTSYSLPSSPIDGPSSSTNSCDVYRWDDLEQKLQEDQINSTYQFNFPVTYHIQNEIRNINTCKECRETVSVSTTMDNLKISHSRDNFMYQDVLGNQYNNFIKYQDMLRSQHNSFFMY